MRHSGSLPSYKENGPSWSVTSAGEAISLGKKRHQRSQRDCSATEEKIYYKLCLIGVLLRIAVMWWIWVSVYLYTTYLSLAIKQPGILLKIQQTKWELIQFKQQFYTCRNEPWWKLLTYDRSVIIFYRSCDLQPGRNWKLVLYGSVLVVSRSDIFSQSLSSCETKWSAALTISFEILRSHTLKWINIIVLRTPRRKNYSCGLLRAIYLSEKTAKQVTCRFAI